MFTRFKIGDILEQCVEAIQVLNESYPTIHITYYIAIWPIYKNLKLIDGVLLHVEARHILLLLNNIDFM